MNPNELRSSHPSLAQVESLVEFMERNPGLAKGFLRTQNARERSRRQWEELAVRLNSLGGTIKNYKQWTKYWSDKKSTIKKKVAARSAARRKTGGGVEAEVELSELEERIVNLCGGEGFSIGDAHLGIQPFQETNISSPSHHTQEHFILDAGTDNADVPQQHHSPSAQDASPIIFSDPDQISHNQNLNRPTPRRLFDSSTSTSQNIFDPIQTIPVSDAHTYHPSLSPPPATLSHTPTPLTMPTPSPSRRGSTVHVGRRRDGTSSSSCRASTHRTRASRGIGTLSSCHTPPVAPPPSQRRTEFLNITERFLRIEEEQLEIQRTNARILQVHLERSAERERVLAEAVTVMGKGLEAVAVAIKRDAT